MKRGWPGGDGGGGDDGGTGSFYGGGGDGGDDNDGDGKDMVMRYVIAAPLAAITLQLLFPLILRIKLQVSMMTHH